jgi:DNA-binding MarR family transcriptional regulator
VTTPPDDRDTAGARVALQPHASELLRALLDYRAAEEAMRRRTGDSMGMGASDLQAIRFLMKEAGEGRIVSGRDLADHLGVTSASVSALLDRLTTSGHVQRLQHPTNRRSNMLTATPEADAEVRQTLGAMHVRMIEATRSLSPSSAEVVHNFLTAMTVAVDDIDRDGRAA